MLYRSLDVVTDLDYLSGHFGDGVFLCVLKLSIINDKLLFYSFVNSFVLFLLKVDIVDDVLYFLHQVLIDVRKVSKL